MGFILLGRMLVPGNLGRFARHPAMSDSSSPQAASSFASGRHQGSRELIVLGLELDPTWIWANACVWRGVGARPRAGVSCFISPGSGPTVTAT